LKNEWKKTKQFYKTTHSSLEAALSYWTMGATDPFFQSNRAIKSGSLNAYLVAQTKLLSNAAMTLFGGKLIQNTSQTAYKTTKSFVEDGIKKYKSSRNASVGYHATKPEYVQSILTTGLRESKRGRLGPGVYVADTPKGAIAEFKHYFPDLKPAIIKVKYFRGENVDLRKYQNNTYKPTYGQGNRISKRTSYDSITFQSQRGGTANTVIRNGSSKPIRRW
jgi:hypothetical protein